ncbi:MAG: DUF2336 domain-containing protein [Bdellovibrionales bacterium]
MTISYEDAKHIAKNGTYAERAKLAADTSAPPEILVFLAADSSPSVRAALASNPALPIPAVKLLASDAEMLVRLAIMQHVLNIWQQRPADPAHAAEHDLARQSLELLATDSTLAVREALASAIVDCGAAPPQVAEKLALDAAQSVAEPILRGYAQLDDDFLIDVLASRSESWARIAIATRQTISGDLADAVVRLDDIETTRKLLLNKGVRFTDATYDYMVDQATTHPDYQLPLAERHDLPQRIAVRMAEFVDEAVFNVLTVRGDFDAATAREIVQTARRRIDWMEANKVPTAVRVRELYDKNELTEDAILDAIAWRDEDFIVLSLAVRSRIPPETTRTMLKSQNAKAVMALSWKAGLSARAGLKLQKSPGDVPPHKLVHPRGGTEYPMEEAELLWQLEFYGVQS